MSLTPRIDSLESTTGGLSTQLTTPVVKLTYLTAVNGTPSTGQFRSSVTNRAPMVDLSNDLMPRMGIERMQIQQIVRVFDEFGPSGQPVFKPVNDHFDQVRFWGSGLANAGQGFGNTGGPNIVGVGDNVEITFYGTGLNLLTANDGSDRIDNIFVDGVGPDATKTNAGSTVIFAKGYAVNVPVSITSGLSLGIHTVLLTFGSSMTLYGFEILNESNQVKVSTGSSAVNGGIRTLSVLNSSAYNSGFESGTLGTRGGRVLVYQKSDGTIGKAVTPAGASAAFMTSADHTNEEVTRVYNWREFGVGSSNINDFSTIAVSSSDRAFTLDDGTTSMRCNDMLGYGPATINTYNAESLVFNSVTSEVSFTFVGTGIDVGYTVGNSGTSSGIEHYIDGVLVGTVTVTSSNYNETRAARKIASGLPYGTHTFRMLIPGGYNINYGILHYTVYGPKKPTLPTGAVELGEYNIMADYVANTGGTIHSSTGTLRKQNMRECYYSGTWTLGGVDNQFASGLNVFSTVGTSYVEYTFFGTGIEHKLWQSGGALNYTYSIDGVTNLTGAGYTTAFHSTTLGTMTFNGATGVLSGTPSGASYGNTVRITNMPLGKHTIRVTYNSGANLYNDCFDVITPIHVNQDLGPASLQGAIEVGSQGIKDLRQFGDVIKKRNMKGVSRYVGGASTTSTELVATPIFMAFKNTKPDLLFSYNAMVYHNTTGSDDVILRPYVDGVPIGINTQHIEEHGANENMYIGLTVPIHLEPGWHFIQMFLRSNAGGTAGIAAAGGENNISIVELD